MRLRKATLIFLVLVSMLAPAARSIDRAVFRLIRNNAKINKIVIEGNHYFSDSKIRDHMYSRERNLFSALNSGRRTRVQRETIGRDTLEVKFLYLSKGFMGVKVDEEFTSLENDSAVIITMNIDEGRQYHYGTPQLMGDYPSAYTLHFNKLLKRLKPGAPADFYQIQQIVFDMKTYLANRGFPYARVTGDLDTVDCRQDCPVMFTILADSSVHFGTVSVVGTQEFPEYVARRELKVKEGALYKRDDIIDSQRRLYESGYFNSFTLAESDKSQNRLEPDFVLRVNERKPHYVNATTGAVGQSDLRDLSWVVTGGFGTLKMFGSRKLDLSAEYLFSVGTEWRLARHVYAVRYVEPWFLGLRMPLILSAEWRPRVRSELQNYDIESWSLSASSRKNFGRFTRLEFGIEYEPVNITGASQDSIPIILEQEGRQDRRRLYLLYRRDTRDHPFIPTSGTVTELSGEYVGGFLGGDANYTKYQATWSRYNRVWPGWILAARFRVGWAGPFGKSASVPTEDRFYLGGANTIEGFKERSLGPVEDDVALGANYVVLYNQEFRWKTLQVLQVIPGLGGFLGKFPLWQSVFFDAGNGFGTFDEINISNFAYSYGTGIQIVSPAGPIRLDYARRIATDRYTAGHRWHFTILYAF